MPKTQTRPTVTRRKAVSLSVTDSKGSAVASDIDHGGAVHKDHISLVDVAQKLPDITVGAGSSIQRLSRKETKGDVKTPTSSPTKRRGKGKVEAKSALLEEATRCLPPPSPSTKSRAKIEQFSFDDTITFIRDQWKARNSWVRAQTRLTNAIHANCYSILSGDDKRAPQEKGELTKEQREAEAKLYAAMLSKGEHPLASVALGANFPLIQAREAIEFHRRRFEADLQKRLVVFPVYQWAQSVRGFGPLTLLGIIGECGDLSNYDDIAKLWKRMGLAVMPDGTRQRRIRGEEAIAHGYAPHRRSLMWNCEQSIVKAGGRLSELYRERKEIELVKLQAIAEEGKTASRKHAHDRALRYVSKFLLRQLWNEWRRTTDPTHPRHKEPFQPFEA